jgi:hypothetical protein
MVTTRTDTGVVKWRINDEVIRLRQWGTDIIHRLESPPEEAYTIGTDTTSTFRIVDPESLASRRHCRISFEDGRWILRDLDSKNGMFVDGAVRAASVLEPGVEIRLGTVTLLAESRRLVELRRFFARILGWSSRQLEAVDHALRAVRLAATGRAALVLCGDGELVPIAENIHALVLGPDKPFILCDPRRRTSDATVRSVENYEKGMVALEHATGGTLCLWSKRKPRDFIDLTTALRQPEGRAQLIVCANSAGDGSAFVAAPIRIPSLRTRSNEVDLVIKEYADDAMNEFSAHGTFTTECFSWVKRHFATTLPAIEKTTRRLVVYQHCESVTRAAALLGMAPASLQEWLSRRDLPPRLPRSS